jgi:hypothetical protein
MMRTLKPGPHACLQAAALLAPLLLCWPAVAQQTTTPVDAPPKLEKLEEGEPPTLKLDKPEVKQKVTQRADGGQIQEEQVQSGGSTYYVHPNQQVGTAQPGDAQSTTNHGVQWKVYEFDLGAKDKKNEAGTPPAGDSAPSTPGQK